MEYIRGFFIWFLIVKDCTKDFNLTNKILSSEESSVKEKVSKDNTRKRKPHMTRNIKKNKPLYQNPIRKYILKIVYAPFISISLIFIIFYMQVNTKFSFIYFEACSFKNLKHFNNSENRLFYEYS